MKTIATKPQLYAIKIHKITEEFSKSFGIYAKAKILVGDTLQVIKSPGRWGIESDDDVKDAEREELLQLHELLENLGIDLTNWADLAPTEYK